MDKEHPKVKFGKTGTYYQFGTPDSTTGGY